MTQQRKAYCFGLAAVLCWSTVATAFKISLSYLSPAQMLLIASLVSTTVLTVTLHYQGGLKALRQLSPRDIVTSFAFGALNPTLYYLVLFQAYDVLSAQQAQAINYTWALTMALLAVPLLGQRLRRQDIIAALLCYCGVLYIATGGQPLALQFDNTTGVLLALASTVIWALYWILNTRDKRPALLGLLLNFACSLPLIALYCLVHDEFHAVPWQGVVGASYIGIFEMGLAFVFWLQAMKLTDSTAKISNLIFISPFLSLLLIAGLLGEVILPSTLFGLAMIIVGLLCQQGVFRLPRKSTSQ
ncbi:drug/metabolite transporter (DMT)-like permease [Sinobacterium caligoides]|uniref:Drug/metabolite transporter (DMT)-like permease n=1 Tax=Sinobacterium caligoides TaxID=933926 RepID=A0A3N2DQ35_9GAMM|nr:DMT family transporter [Sinobacterium caligoides]ROS01729.1 drug/metabolite transporter (DMT)-like permease [Sinobacterium caligoides]